MKGLGFVLDRRMVPNNVRVLISGTCEYVRWQRRIKAVDQIKAANQLTLK